MAKPLSGGRVVVPPVVSTRTLGNVPRLEGQEGKAPERLIDLEQWEQFTPEELIAKAFHLCPQGTWAEAISYDGVDLVPATLLAEPDLAAEYTPPTSEYLAGKGFDNVEFWEELARGNTEILRWVWQGYSEYVPIGDAVPWVQRQNNPNTAAHVGFVTAAVQELQQVQAIRDITHLKRNKSIVRVVAPLTVALHSSGKMRLCWNGRPVNAYLPQRHFKMEHAEKAAKMMRLGDWMFTIDMKSGYHQVPCKPWFKRLLCFEWQGRVYQWQVMPFAYQQRLVHTTSSLVVF